MGLTLSSLFSYSPRTDYNYVYPARFRFLRHHSRLYSKYRISKAVLGRGKYGVVRRAIDRETGEAVAIKTIPKRDADRTQLEREVSALRRLEHPSVVRLLDFIEDADYFHLVSEICEGGDAFDRLKARGVYPEARAQRILYDLLLAVQYCHANGIVHRDLKIENLVFLDASEDSPAKLIDFGFAHELPGSPDEAKEAPKRDEGEEEEEVEKAESQSALSPWESLSPDSTSPPSSDPLQSSIPPRPMAFSSSPSPSPVSSLSPPAPVSSPAPPLSPSNPRCRDLPSRSADGPLHTKVGTNYYVAPEVLKGSYGDESDVWSLGVVAYVLLCGYPPFRGPSDAVIFRKIEHGLLTFPTQHWSSISEEAKDFIGRLLVTDPRRRLSPSEALRHPWFAPLRRRAMIELSTVMDTTGVAHPEASLDRECLEGLQKMGCSDLYRWAMPLFRSPLSRVSIQDAYDCKQDLSHSLSLSSSQTCTAVYV